MLLGELIGLMRSSEHFDSS